ncbi:type I-E CRISPR-associated protein Cse1/CasA [Entomobacter blattae]|uniref:CRISPR-associated protein Cse1 n=1 Tax=Entomobacter blattae TaxID=2762277 RepID=A0A7H1NU64_9PROT|nr:type I-E CRISPR-associated protein Cse1/CasA [Entomobacter blattae]QNT79324.1 CRISPR-associated protein Cse1 [Entomobacter blattae]
MQDSWFNLIHQAWLPVRRKSGILSTIRPAEVVEAYSDDPIMDVEWPRADFQIASYEFLIGLLATAFSPDDHDEWLDLWEEPPSVARLDEAYDPIAKAFFLDGPGPRFLQDYSELEADLQPIERLLINAPGESTIKQNKDLFVHRDQVAQLGRPAAAMALFALQSWAPSGGQGNKTGLRGGGPLVTLVLPQENASLWQILWANTPCGKRVTEKNMETVFPWLAPTLLSGKEKDKVRPGENADTLQCWWGMPRRIRLEFTAVEEGYCDLTEQKENVLVTGWRQRPHGPDYAGWIGEEYSPGVVVHPLTPAYRQKDGAEWLSLHPQPGGIHYRHWVGLVVSTRDGNRLPASMVAQWHSTRAVDCGLTRKGRLLAAGYDMDSMKARSFVESEMPLPGAADEELRERIDHFARCCIDGVNQVWRKLTDAVKNALFDKKNVSLFDKKNVLFDKSVFSNLQHFFISNTEGQFFELLNKVGEAEDDVFFRMAWLKTLKNAVISGFDRTVLLGPETSIGHAERIARCRRQLLAFLACSGKEGRALAQALELPLRERSERK